MKCTASALAAILLAPRAIAQYTTYTVTDLSAGVYKRAQRNMTGLALNNLGAVVGTITPPPDEGFVEGYDGFLWTPNSANGVSGKLSGINVGGTYDTYPNGINDAGIIVGTAYLDEGIVLSNPIPFYITDKLHVDLFSKGYGDYEAVSNKDVIAGALGQSDVDYVAAEVDLRETNGVAARYLGTLGDTFNTAFAINDRSWAAGSAVAPIGGGITVQHPFLSFVPGDPVIDLGTLGGSNGVACGLKPAGDADTQAVVVGQADLAPQFNRPGAVFSHAFVATCNAGVPASVTMHDLGTLNGQSSLAYSINKNGLIVGYSDVDVTITSLTGLPFVSNGGQHGFIAAYPASAGVPSMVDLHSLIDDPNLIINEARAINSAGQILVNGGSFTNPGGGAFLLTPTGAAPTKPKTPGAFVLSSNSSSTVLAGWHPESGNAASFVVERRLGDLRSTQPWVEAGKAERAPFAYMDENLQRNTTYTYRIKARNSFGDSNLTSPVAVTTRLATDNVTSHVQVDQGSIQLDPTTGLYTQQIIISNPYSLGHAYALPFDVFLVLNRLRGATLVNADGITHDRTFLWTACPYITATPGVLNLDASVTITLTFAKTGDISYTPLVLADEQLFDGGGFD